MDRVLADLFRDAPLRDRTHIRLRWSSCPFPEVAAAVPERGRILEIGCGHGLFSAYLAAGSPQRDVVGIDIDERKIALAELAIRRGAKMRVQRVEPGALPDGTWDAAVIVDVLYLLPEDDQRRMISLAARALAEGGRLIVKETALRPAWKFRLTQLQELLMVKITRITAGQDIAFVGSEAIAGWMRAEGLSVSERPLEAGSLHPHVLIVGDRR